MSNVATFTNDLIQKRKLLFSKDDIESKETSKSSQYEKISTESNEILFYNDRI